MLFAFGLDVETVAIVGAIAVMLFGKDLPDVARKVGRGWADIKKSLSGIQAEFNSALYSDTPSSSSSRKSNSYTNAIDDYEEQTAPKFEPPPAEPPAQAGGNGAAKATAMDAEVAAIMPSLAKIDEISTEPCKEWRDDTSWADVK